MNLKANLTNDDIIKALKDWAEKVNHAVYFEVNENGAKELYENLLNAICLIDRLQTQNEALIAGQETLQKALADEIAKGNICAEVIARQDKEIAKYKEDIKELNTIRSRLIYDGDTYTKITDELYQKIKAEATKEFAESYTENFITLFDLNYSQAEAARKLKERVVKEMAGEEK